MSWLASAPNAAPSCAPGARGKSHSALQRAMTIQVTERISTSAKRYAVMSQVMSLEAHGVAADAYQSADLACERLEKRVRRYKRRVKRHGGHSARKETPAASYVLQSRREGQEESDEDNPIIIA